LRQRVRAIGGEDVSVGELSSPPAGFSGKTVFARASWRHSDGVRREHDLVLRLQSPDNQLFLAPDALRQAETMRGLARRPGVPVPEILFTEGDPGPLGVPFYVMGRVPGRVPGDVPSWHDRGWTVELAPHQRARLYDNGLAAVIALHRVDWTNRLAFLAAPGSGTALDRYLQQVCRLYEWCGPSRRFGPDTLRVALEDLLDNRPDDPAEVVVWGDARVGNMCFAEDLSVAALFDWEAATTGPPGIDLGWWLMFERYLCEAQGLRRLEGVPGRAETIARYHELGGVAVPEVDYYELLAAVVMTLITSRLADVLTETGRVTADVAARYPDRSARLVAEYLARRQASAEQ
jgi:aminoglycoside phosphotransferase (APT) family kinase protein